MPPTLPSQCPLSSNFLCSISHNLKLYILLIYELSSPSTCKLSVDRVFVYLVTAGFPAPGTCLARSRHSVNIWWTVWAGLRNWGWGGGGILGFVEGAGGRTATQHLSAEPPGPWAGTWKPPGDRQDSLWSSSHPAPHSGLGGIHVNAVLLDQRSKNKIVNEHLHMKLHLQ